MEPNRLSAFFSGLGTGKKYAIAILGLLLFIAVIVFSYFEATKATVTVVVDGEETTVSTHAQTVGELIEELGFEVGEYDEIIPAEDTNIESYLVIEWKIAKQVHLTVDGNEKTIYTTASNVRSLLDEQKITLKEHDNLNVKLDAPIEEGMEIVYERAFLVTLNSDGGKYDIWTTSTTVADLLKKENIELGELDRVEPALEEKLTKETEINVIRVEKVTDVVEEEVDFATVTRRDNQLASGKEKIIQEGSKGLVRKHYEVVLENGQEVSRKLLKEETVKETRDRIVAVGTRPVTTTVARGGYAPQTQAVSGKTLIVTATAYTANCRGCSGITKTGINLKQNRNAKVIAVDPNVIPLGTRVYVEGYGEAIAADVGSSIRGNRIDVYVPTQRDAALWGRRTVKVTILN